MASSIGLPWGPTLRPRPREAPSARRPAVLARAETSTASQDSAALRKNPALYSSDAAAALPAGPSPTTSIPSAPAPNLSLPRHKPEVLAPAGGWPQLRAAVENGADAVYFGVDDLNARARASNFAAEELPEVMTYLHTRAVKGYLVLNVLVFDNELTTVAQRAQHAASAGVDAVIVQDVGAVEVIRAAAPGLQIHGSTQMTITSAEGAAFAAAQGIERVVLGRELSVKDIVSITSTSIYNAKSSGINAAKVPEVEIFVHGALCVSYSGQCFSSEAWGGRSANRGQCAQACRLDYGLLVDGELRALGDVSYLLSPQDLAAVDLVPDLTAAGVVSFKIEGRLKGPEYVALTTKVYRDAVDAAWEALQASGGDGSGTGGQDQTIMSPAARRDLRQVFARGQDGAYDGLTPGFLEGPRHQRLVRGRAPRHRGVFLGKIEAVDPGAGTLTLRLSAPLRRGDGVVVDGGNPQEAEVGGAVYEIRALVEAGKSGRRGGSGPRNASYGPSVLEAEEGALVEAQIGGDGAGGQLRRVRPGQLLWKNKDPVLESKLQASFEGLSAAERRRVPVAVALSGSTGAPLRLTLVDAQGRRAAAETQEPLQPATGRPLSPEALEKAIGVHLGDEGSLVATSFDYSSLDLEGGSGLFLPAAAIKEARRRAVAALLEQQLTAPAEAEAGPAGSAAAPPGTVIGALLRGVAEENRRWAAAHPAPAEEAPPGTIAAGMLRVLCRTKAQVDAAIAVPWLFEVVLDFLEVHGLKEACQAVRAAGKRVIVASPRVLKPDERRLWLFYLRLNADVLLVRCTGMLQQLMAAGGPGATVPGADGSSATIPLLEGDFSLNATNIVSTDLLLRSGLSRLAPTHDCNAEQLAGLAHGLGPRAAALEIILHQNLPVFHTEHCVFARFLSDGDSFLDCGKPCERHTVHLRGAAGVDHLVLADMGCRNTVFEGQAQSGLPYVDRLVAAGVGCFRVELVDQPPALVGPLLEGYRAAIEAAMAQKRGGGMRNEGRVDVLRALWRWMGAELTDANGRAHGVGTGSLEPRAERDAASLRPTAAARRAVEQRGGGVGQGKKAEQRGGGGGRPKAGAAGGGGGSKVRRRK